jgi:hypothetical protein
LRWHCGPIKSKSKIAFPCYICPDVDEASAGRFGEIKVTKRNDTLVKFLGCKCSYRDKVQAVPANQLEPYYDENEEGGSTTWSQSKLKIFRASLESQKVYQTDKKKIDLRTEELALQFLLDAILKREQDEAEMKRLAAQQQQSSLPSLMACTSEGGDENAGDGDESRVDTFDDNGDSEMEPKRAAVNTNRRAPLSTALPEKCKQKLRAGDVIVYKYVWPISAPAMLRKALTNFPSNCLQSPFPSCRSRACWC